MSDELATLTERINNWITSTEAYRSNLNTKLEKMGEQLGSLNCNVHTVKMDHLTREITRLWSVIIWAIIFIVGAVLGHVFKLF